MRKWMVLAAFAGVASPAGAGERTVWELRQAGTGLRCVISTAADAEGARRTAIFDPRCAEIAEELTGGFSIDEDGDRIAFMREDGVVALEFVSGEGDVFESVDAQAPPMLLSFAE